MQCAHCGAQLHEGDRICIHCGELVATPVPEDDAPRYHIRRSQATDPNAKPVEPPVITPSPHPVNHPAYGHAPVNQRPRLYTDPIDAHEPEEEEVEADDNDSQEDLEAQRTLGVGGYLGAMVVYALPLIGLLVCLIWACGGTRRIALRKLSRARLILTLINWFIGFIILGILSPYLASLFSLLSQALPYLG